LLLLFILLLLLLPPPWPLVLRLSPPPYLPLPLPLPPPPLLPLPLLLLNSSPSIVNSPLAPELSTNFSDFRMPSDVMLMPPLDAVFVPTVVVDPRTGIARTGRCMSNATSNVTIDVCLGRALASQDSFANCSVRDGAMVLARVVLLQQVEIGDAQCVFLRAP
jgi:hypothetical protein